MGISVQHDKGKHHQCGSMNALRFFQAEAVIDFYLVSYPHLALKTLNHFEAGVWRHLPQSKALIASDTSVKRRRF